jgi:hypothetical protein
MFQNALSNAFKGKTPGAHHHTLLKRNFLAGIE